MLVDSHCHLDYYPPEQRSEIIKNAREAGVFLMQTISTSISKFPLILEIAELEEFIYASIGTHPENAAKETFSSEYIADICIRHPNKIIGIGETGLDYFHKDYHKKAQQEAFIQHIQAGQKTGLPLIIHTRNADEDTLSILKEALQEKKFKILMHCFTGNEAFAYRLLEIGAYISFSGIVTFKNAQEVRKSLLVTPLDRLLIETDAPFLAPDPFRGKQNEPAYLKYTADFIAKTRNISIENLSSSTTENFLTLFNLINKR